MNGGRVVSALLLFGLIVVVAEGWARNARDFVIASVGGTPPTMVGAVPKTDTAQPAGDVVGTAGAPIVINRAGYPTH